MKLTKEQIHSIDKALAYIESHLEDDLTLDQISSQAHYSPYHFHRIFKSFTNETLNQYITRKRVERASADLLHRENLSISEISDQRGFNSNSSFTRAFKKYYGMSPSDFRKKSKGKYSKIRQVKGKNGIMNATFEAYVCSETNRHTQNMTSNINICTIDPINIAGITCIGKQELNGGFERLLNWAGQKGLLRQPDFKVATVFYDSFKITAPDKVRMTAGLVVDIPIQSDGEVSNTTLKGGNYIVGHYTINIGEFPTVWSNLFKWMNDNGYKKRDLPPFEIYHNDFNQHPEKKCIVDLYIPVE